ncbi:MAG: sigma-54 dependent transcriptional regulator [bacterium]|nr:sigma-54 dependent transcriptional regulator [bacterium]
MEKILVIDDNESVRFALTELLEEHGFEVISFDNGTDALKDISTSNHCELVILDMKLPGMSGIDILKGIKSKKSHIPVIMLTAFGDIKTAVNAMKEGATDFITKPFDNDSMIKTIRKTLEMNYLKQEVNLLRRKVESTYKNSDVIGNCKKMKEVLDQVQIVAPSTLSVLIQGESGTGKEIIACMIHKVSDRKDKPFIAVDCGAIPESLIESELFGHEKGAFTDARTSKEGKFELANDGTIFLDEITNLSDSNQIKLLRVIQERKVTRLGAKSPVKLNIRIISATNIRLSDAVNNKNFRQDLYYRMNEFHIDLPPLRERKEDIKSFVQYFIKDANNELNKNVREVDEKILDQLVNHSWPGNVRELRNVIRRAVLMAKNDRIASISIPDDIYTHISKNEDLNLSMNNYTKSIEKDLILKAMEDANGNKSKAAKLLNINERTFYRKLKSLGIS